MRVKHHRDLLKLYDKYRRILRNECTCNDPRRFGVGKLLTNFSALRDRMTVVLQRFLRLQHAVLDSTLDRGQLAALAQTSELGRSRVPGIRLENERIMTVLHLLGHLGTDGRGFTSSQLRQLYLEQTGQPYSSSQTSYDLRKLRGKTILEQLPAGRRYILTPRGVRLAAVLDKLRFLFLGPTVAIATSPVAPSPRKKPRGPKREATPSQQLRQLLAEHAGNVSAVARAMGRQRCVVSRWIKRDNLDLQHYQTPVVRPDIEEAYRAVDNALTQLATCLRLRPAA